MASDRIVDKIAALPDDSTYFSLEFFPPKTQQVRGDEGQQSPEGTFLTSL
jgi:hypothetical protein